MNNNDLVGVTGEMKGKIQEKIKGKNKGNNEGNNKGQNTGMQAWKIKLVTTDETELNINKTMLRCLISTISFACLGLGYLWILYHKDDLSWSDILTKTKVIKTNQ